MSGERGREASCVGGCRGPYTPEAPYHPTFFSETKFHSQPLSFPPPLFPPRHRPRRRVAQRRARSRYLFPLYPGSRHYLTCECFSITGGGPDPDADSPMTICPLPAARWEQILLLSRTHTLLFVNNNPTFPSYFPQRSSIRRLRHTHHSRTPQPKALPKSSQLSTSRNSPARRCLPPAVVSSVRFAPTICLL